MNADLVERSYATLGSVLDNVKEDQLDDPTPCLSWKVRDIVNHVVGGTTYFAITVETGTAPDTNPNEPPDIAGGDFRTAFTQGSQRALAAMRAEGALDKSMKMPFGEIPGPIIANIAASDAFVHGWDLAKATGQSTDLDPALATELLGNARQIIPDAMRGTDGEMPFGPKIEAPESAPAATKLAAFLGRQP